MTKKTILCVLVLAMTGMLCVPVAAELHNEDDWSFFIVDHITAITDVEINGHIDRDAGEIQCIHVPAGPDHVSVNFHVKGGPDTKLTITREYIDMLRKEYPGMEPVLYASGLIDTYDVDAGGMKLETIDNEKRVYYTTTKEYPMTIHEHLEKRGLVHTLLENPFSITADAYVYNRFVELHTDDDWSFFIVDSILAVNDVKINGQGDRDADEIQIIHVPASLNRVSVKFDVAGGPDTNLTITREYIDMLREKYPGMEPTIYAFGLIDTYDVDAGGTDLKMRHNEDRRYGAPIQYNITIHEHLIKRAVIHTALEKPFCQYSRANYIYNRFLKLHT